VRGGGVFRRRNPTRTQAEEETAGLTRRGRAAARTGNFAAAAEAHAAAARMLRALAATDPGNAADDLALGDAQYELGDALLAGGRPEAAVVALDEAEEAYGRLSPRRFPAADRIADVQARRAIAYGVAGAGGSALVDAQSAVLHYRPTAGEDPAEPRRRDLARALAANADVLAGYGDPDLAVASADLAVRLFLPHAGESADDTAELRRALAVAIAVHSAHGRHHLADQAGTVTRRLGGLPGGVPTVLGVRQHSRHPPVLAVTVATALDAARQRLGRQPPRIGDRAVVRPAVDVELVVPLDRVLVPLGPGDRSADAAARLGSTLAKLAVGLLQLDGARGARLGLEAHALLAGASRLESEVLRHQLPALGPPWAAALLACSRRAEADRDPALALDLAAWAGGVSEQLFPATLVDREARTVAVEVLDHHGRLLALRGEQERARYATRAAARLRAM
jgi:tetratricopeptide (TPR) repeat protein